MDRPIYYSACTRMLDEYGQAAGIRIIGDLRDPEIRQVGAEGPMGYHTGCFPPFDDEIVGVQQRARIQWRFHYHGGLGDEGGLAGFEDKFCPGIDAQ